MIYAGIGSRNTPCEWLVVMERIGRIFGARGWTLRSGGAAGADSAFERGAAGGAVEIFLPWPDPRRKGGGIVLAGAILERALLLASVVHPNWKGCNGTSRLLHARDVAQVWGADLVTPADIVICWAPPTSDGGVFGGTRTAVAVARAARIPVFNLAVPGALERLRALYRGHSTAR